MLKITYSSETDDNIRIFKTITYILEKEIKIEEGYTMKNGKVYIENKQIKLLIIKNSQWN